MGIESTTISDTNGRTGRRAWLDVRAARSYERMKAAGAPAGCVSDAGRTFAEQQHMRDLYLAGTGNFALPAGQSRHESGHALDIAEPTRAWVRSRGREFGWVKDVNPAEDWHMEYVAELDEHADETEEDAMAELDMDQVLPLTGTAADVLGGDKQKLGSALGYASASFRQGMRDSAKILAELRAIRRAIGQVPDEKELAAEIVALLADDLADLVNREGTKVGVTSAAADVIARRVLAGLRQRLAE